MRKIARIDSNQTEIVKDLRRLGICVWSTAPLGNGFPDLCLGVGGKNYLFELKSGNNKKLTLYEDIFIKNWRGQANVVTSVEQILKIVNYI